jgi:hypothetical protein
MLPVLFFGAILLGQPLNTELRIVAILSATISLKFRSFEAVEHRIAESPNELSLDVPN